MLGVSGIVPDGVAAAYLTAPDGTAVKADVKDNGYEFLIPRPRTVEQRYVVWTGGDGTPHVQPVTAMSASRGLACPRIGALAKVPRITPVSAFQSCPVARPIVVTVRTKHKRVARPVPLPVPVLVRGCSAAPTALTPQAGPPAVFALPAPLPRKHR